MKRRDDMSTDRKDKSTFLAMKRLTIAVLSCLAIAAVTLTLGALILNYTFTNYKEEKCEVSDCQEIIYECQQCSDSDCVYTYMTNCSSIIYNYTLTVHNDTYTKSSSDQKCPNGVTCYYRPNNIYKTLTNYSFRRKHLPWESGVGVSLLVVGSIAFFTPYTLLLLAPRVFKNPKPQETV